MVLNIRAKLLAHEFVGLASWLCCLRW
jgi:hypothetical protein